MATGKVYYDTEGNECSIWRMVIREPHWAAVRIQEGEKAIDEIARLRAELESARVDAERLSNAINKHNDEMDAMCANKSRCGYAPYNRKCPECPTDYKIDAAIDAARGGK